MRRPGFTRQAASGMFAQDAPNKLPNSTSAATSRGEIGLGGPLTLHANVDCAGMAVFEPSFIRLTNNSGLKGTTEKIEERDLLRPDPTPKVKGGSAP